jgi:hypothetical protein
VAFGNDSKHNNENRIMNSNMLGKVKRGVVNRPQRVVLYGVESVGKTTLAALAPNPIILDVEGGSSHIDVPRIDVGTWLDIQMAVKELAASPHDFKTVIVDSMDWAEKLNIEAMLVRDHKAGIEENGLGKGNVMAAERTTRVLSCLDLLIERGIGVVLIAHAKVVKFEPPDGMQAYDRYELKMTRHTSPLVKEWADSLLFANFKTKVVNTQDGKAKGIGGKERVLLTARSAAWDAKCRIPATPEEMPMTAESLRYVLQLGAPKTATPERKFDETPTVDPWEVIEWNCEGLPVDEFLRDRKIIGPDQTWRNAPTDYLQRVVAVIDKFSKAVADWNAARKVAV